jgi:hypothetical protein
LTFMIGDGEGKVKNRVLVMYWREKEGVKWVRDSLEGELRRLTP